MARAFVRRIELAVDPASMGKFMSEFERVMATSGEQGAAKMRRALDESLKLTIAKLQKDLADGLIDQKTFARLKYEAERGFVQTLSKGMEDLRKQGNLTDAEMVKLAGDLARVMKQADRTAADFDRLTHSISQSESAADALSRTLSHDLDLAVAKLRKDLADGLIDQRTFEKLKSEAESGFVRALSRGMDDLQRRGRLTDAEFVKLSGDLARVSQSADRSADEFHRLGKEAHEAGQQGSQGGQAMEFAWGKIFGAGGVFEIGRRVLDGLLTGIRSVLGRLVRLLIEAPQQAMEADAIWNHLQTTVESVGKTYSDVQGQIEERVASLYETTKGLFDDDEIAQGLDQLIAGTRNYTWSVKNLELATNLAAREHIKVGEAADIVAKVYNGNTKVLKGHNIVVRDGETALNALRRVTREYAEKEARSFQGQITGIRNDLGNVVEDLGSMEIAGADGATAIDKVRNSIKDLSKWMQENRGQIVHWIRTLISAVTALVDYVIMLVRIPMNIMTTFFRMTGLAYQLAVVTMEMFIEAAIVRFNRFVRVINAAFPFVNLPEIGNPFGRDVQRRLGEIRSLTQGIRTDFNDIVASGRNFLQATADFGRTFFQPVDGSASGRGTTRGGGGGGEDPDPTGKGDKKDRLLEELRQYQQILQFRKLTTREVERILSIQRELNALLARGNLTREAELKIWEKLDIIRNRILPIVMRLPQVNVQDPDDNLNRLAERYAERRLRAAEKVAEARKQIIDAFGTENIGDPAILEKMLNDEQFRSHLITLVAAWKEAHAEMLQASQSVAAGVMDSFSQAFGLLFQEGANFGAFFTTLGTGMSRALLGALSQYAGGKVVENIAHYFDAKALAATYSARAAEPLNPLALHYVAAAVKMKAAMAGHLKAAAAWAVVGGVASGAGAAIGGGGGGGGGVSSASGSGGAQQQQQQQPSTIPMTTGGATPGFVSRPVAIQVAITNNFDPWDPNSPRHQDILYKTTGQVVERYGNDAFTKPRGV